MFERLKDWMSTYGSARDGAAATRSRPAAPAQPVKTPPASQPARKSAAVASLADVAAAFHGTLLRPQEKEATLSSDLEAAIYKDVLAVIRSGVHPEDLPKLPAAVAQLLQKLRDENTTARDIVTLINQEPVLASSVLKVANSPYYRTGEDEISSIEQAVQRLGFDRLSTITLSILMRPVFDVKPIYFRQFSKYLWEHSQDCAIACAELARKAGEDYFTAYLVGLVHDIGKLVIFQALMKAMKEAHPDVHPDPRLVGTIVDRTSLQLSCVSLKHWELPKVVQLAVCDQVKAGADPDRLGKLSYLLYTANLLSEFHLLLTENRLSDDEADEILGQYGLSAAMVHGLFKD
ncbi:MAG: HDOD domain-containing protein [Pseudomonadota bacterium]